MGSPDDVSRSLVPRRAVTARRQASEPPDADPLVRWCGRGIAGQTGYPLSRFVRPAWALTWRWKSSGDLVTGTQGNRKVPTVRGALKEAGNETAGRRTETGYQAMPIRASGQMTAKLS